MWLTGLITQNQAIALLKASEKKIPICKANGKRCGPKCCCPLVPEYSDPPIPSPESMATKEDRIRVYAERSNAGTHLYSKHDKHGVGEREALIIEKHRNGRYIKSTRQIAYP